MSRSISRSLSITSRFSSAQLDERGPQIFAGYLSKKGKLNTKYQKRWFVLFSNNKLVYFQDKFAAEGIALGEINLYSVSEIKEENHNLFHLITRKRKFTLKCDIKDDLDEWIKKIKLRVSPNIIYEGPLYKTGSGNKAFKLRYFKLCEYELHYEARYYEDKQYSIYKGKIDCDHVENITILPNTSIKTYGKDLVLELITAQRTYAVAAVDTKSRNQWYKSFKKAVRGVDVDKGKEKEMYEQQIMEEEQIQAKLFDSLSTSVLTQTIKEEAPQVVIAKESTKEKTATKVEVKPDTKQIKASEPYHYKKSPQPFTAHTVSKAASDATQHKKRKSLNDFFDEPKVEQEEDKHTLDVHKEEELNPVIGNDVNHVDTEHNGKDTNPFAQDMNHVIDKQESVVLDESNPFGDNTTVVQQESVVFSKQFLDADYEDPSYGLLENEEPKQRINKCCTIL
eukprot:856061_1